MNICGDFKEVVLNYCLFKAGKGGQCYNLLIKIEEENEIREFVRDHPFGSEDLKCFCRHVAKKGNLTMDLVYTLVAVAGVICENEECETAGNEFLYWWRDLCLSV